MPDMISRVRFPFKKGEKKEKRLHRSQREKLPLVKKQIHSLNKDRTEPKPAGVIDGEWEK